MAEPASRRRDRLTSTEVKKLRHKKKSGDVTINGLTTPKHTDWENVSQNDLEPGLQGVRIRSSWIQKQATSKTYILKLLY